MSRTKFAGDDMEGLTKEQCLSRKKEKVKCTAGYQRFTWQTLEALFVG